MGRAEREMEIRGSLEIEWTYKMYKQYEAPIRYGPSQAGLNHEMRLNEFAVTFRKTVGLFTVFKPLTAAPKEELGTVHIKEALIEVAEPR